MLNMLKDFMAGVGRMPTGWRIWMNVLVFINLVIPLAFIYRFEAQMAIVAAMAGMIIALILVGMRGFTRLLGLMHIFWIPLVIYFWSQLSQIPGNDFFGIWIRVVICLNTLSLVIDAIDVARYVTGDRAAY